MLDSETGWKYITVKRLKELLAKCPDNALIGLDKDNDLLVTDLAQKPISYISISEGVIKRSKE